MSEMTEEQKKKIADKPSAPVESSKNSIPSKKEEINEKNSDQTISKNNNKDTEEETTDESEDSSTQGSEKENKKNNEENNDSEEEYKDDNAENPQNKPNKKDNTNPSGNEPNSASIFQNAQIKEEKVKEYAKLKQAFMTIFPPVNTSITDSLMTAGGNVIVNPDEEIENPAEFGKSKLTVRDLLEMGIKEPNNLEVLKKINERLGKTIKSSAETNQKINKGIFVLGTLMSVSGAVLTFIALASPASAALLVPGLVLAGVGLAVTIATKLMSVYRQIRQYKNISKRNELEEALNAKEKELNNDFLRSKNNIQTEYDTMSKDNNKLTEELNLYKSNMQEINNQKPINSRGGDNKDEDEPLKKEEEKKGQEDKDSLNENDITALRDKHHEALLERNTPPEQALEEMKKLHSLHKIPMSPKNEKDYLELYKKHLMEKQTKEKDTKPNSPERQPVENKNQTPNQNNNPIPSQNNNDTKEEKTKEDNKPNQQEEQNSIIKKYEQKIEDLRKENEEKDRKRKEEQKKEEQTRKEQNKRANQKKQEKKEREKREEERQRIQKEREENKKNLEELERKNKESEEKIKQQEEKLEQLYKNQQQGINNNTPSQNGPANAP